MAAFDMSNPKSIVSPGGVGFDINCGVRLLRTNLHEKDVQPIKVHYYLIDFVKNINNGGTECLNIKFTLRTLSYAENSIMQKKL